MTILADGHIPDGSDDIGGRPKGSYAGEVAKAAPQLVAFSGVLAGSAPLPGEGYVPVMQTKVLTVTIPAGQFLPVTFPEPFKRCVFAVLAVGDARVFAYGPYTTLATCTLKGDPGTWPVTIVAWGC